MSILSDIPAPTEATGPNGSTKTPNTTVGFVELLTAILNGYGDTGTDVAKKEFRKVFSEYLEHSIKKYSFREDYNIIILYDDSVLVKDDADNIYTGVTSFKDTKPLLLLLYSRGGSAASAYLIGKLCREYCNERLVVVVPRFAKSAATLICCAANEIHMGSLSELGPIDPQIDGLPALGLKHAIENIAELVKSSPESAEMFARYMHLSIPPINLGYYERVVSSAAQYAENLLKTHPQDLQRTAKEIADNLVYKYKDHGFVIDNSEAESIFGNKIIQTNTDIYDLGNTVYEALTLTKNMFERLDYRFYMIGNLNAAPTITKRR